MFKTKWLLVLFVASNIPHPLAYPVMNHISREYGIVFLDLLVGVLMGAMMGMALYWLMRDLILSFWVWTLSTALAYGLGAVLYNVLFLALQLPLPKGLFQGALVGVLVGGFQSVMLPWFSKGRWIGANVIGFVVGSVLAYYVGYLWMDVPPHARIFMPGMIGLSVGGATLFVFQKSGFGGRA